MNEKIIDALNDMAIFEDFNHEPFKAKAYRNAIQTIKNLDYEIDVPEQAKGLQGIGTGIYKKIEQLLTKGTFERLEAFKASDAARLKAIANVKGLSMAKAQRLFDAGIDSIDKLKVAVADKQVGDYIIPGIKLTDNIKGSLEFDIHGEKTRMTIQQHDNVANVLINLIQQFPSVKRVDAVGSARRYDGSDGYTVGDIDIIVGVDGQAPDTLINGIKHMLDRVIMAGSTKISGIKDQRQVDVRIVDNSRYGSLLLHSTGSANFNRRCCTEALKRGMMLNEYGLFKRNPDGSKGELLSTDEKDILEKIGIGWVEPNQRKN